MTNQLQHQQRRAVDLRIPAIEKYAYCLCLHVKPTTIFIAVFKLIRALLFASILLNTEFTVNDQSVNEFGLAMDDRHKSTAAAVNILSRIIMASVSAVGIYAVISGRAALLMPLYAILLVDFFFALPAFYNRDLDPTLVDSLADFKNYSTGNNQYTRYSLMLFSTITMVIKIYFLCVVWKCYRYLRLIELVSPIRLSEIYPHIHQNGPQCPIVRVLGSGDSLDMSTGHNTAPPPYDSIASNMKPPNYEEAMKSSTIGFTTNPSMSHQQTMVFTNPSVEPHQNISTQVINDNHHVIARVETMMNNSNDNNTEPYNTELASSTSTIVARDEESLAHQGQSNSNDNYDKTNSDVPPPSSNTNHTSIMATSNPPTVGNSAAITVDIPKVGDNENRDSH